MKKTIKKILKEDFDWVGSVTPDLPDYKHVFGVTKTVTITLQDYIELNYGHNFIIIFLRDGRLIELDTHYDLSYHTYESLEDLLKSQSLIDYHREGYSMNDYLVEFNMSSADSELSEFIHKAIPLDIVGIYVGNH
jgi:hypothetical protein